MSKILTGRPWPEEEPLSKRIWNTSPDRVGYALLIKWSDEVAELERAIRVLAGDDPDGEPANSGQEADEVTR